MSRSRIVILFLAMNSLAGMTSGIRQDSLRHDDACLIEQLTGTLPDMACELRAAGIKVSPENFIWPSEAALHPKTLSLLEKNGFGPLKREGLQEITRTYFFMNYDRLDPARKKILSSSEEQITLNPYLTLEQKRINIRLQHKELGLSRAELAKKVSKKTIRTMRPYLLCMEKMWEKIRKEEQNETNENPSR